MKNNFNFKEDFFVEVNEREYWVEIDGHKYLDEYDNYTWYVEFDSITITDEAGDFVTSNHSDYNDIMDELDNKDIGGEYEPEGLDFGDEDDFSDMF